MTQYPRTLVVHLMKLVAVASLPAIVALLTPGSATAQPATRTVNCDQGKTIASALEQASDHQLTIVVSGTCQENVVITRDRVTLLAAHPGAGVSGPDTQTSTILVRGDQVTIDGLTVTGGSNGITAIGSGQLTVRNSAVTAGRSGIVFFEGASGTVDSSALQGNPRHGLLIERAIAAVTNSTITGNGQHGVMVSSGATGRIGVTPTGGFAGNTISGNRSAGVQVTTGSSAVIGGNTITGNGFVPGGTAGQLPFGVSVFHSQAHLASNTITGNAGSGVVVTAGPLVIGPLVGAPSPANVISDNGSVGFPNAQVMGTQGASIEVRHAQISGATPGVQLHMQSVLNAFGGSVSNTAGNAIELGTGASASFATPAVALTASGVGVQCFGADTSAVGTPAGTVSPTCTASRGSRVKVLDWSHPGGNQVAPPHGVPADPRDVQIRLVIQFPEPITASTKLVPVIRGMRFKDESINRGYEAQVYPQDRFENHCILTVTLVSGGDVSHMAGWLLVINED